MKVAPRYTLHTLFRLFPDYEFGKAQYAFYPKKSSHFAEEKEVRQKYQNFITGYPYKLGKRPLDQQKIQMSNIPLEGPWHPNLMIPFQGGKSFHNN